MQQRPLSYCFSFHNYNFDGHKLNFCSIIHLTIVISGICVIFIFLLIRKKNDQLFMQVW